MKGVLKFVFDGTMAFVGLVLLSPIMLVVAILIKIKMPEGPVMFKQKRVGHHGMLFDIYKFRTMEMGHSGSSVSVSGESRITPLGKVLRRYKLDELPELWCVLKGDMSLVGPRPDVPGYADELQGDDRRILDLRPGITGPASLKYRHEEELIADFVRKMRVTGMPEFAAMTDEQIAVWYNDTVIFPDKVKINLYYLEHYSFWKDIQMIIYTVIGKEWKNGIRGS